MDILKQIELEEAQKQLAKRAIPDFRPGDTLRVNVRIKEGERERVQAFEGVCIARAGAGVQVYFTVRKISFGEGVERVFPLLSPSIESIEVKRRGAVRRAKLYYLRDRRGKSARIAERSTARRPAQRRRRQGRVRASRSAQPGAGNCESAPERSGGLSRPMVSVETSAPARWGGRNIAALSKRSPCRCSSFPAARSGSVRPGSRRGILSSWS